MKKILFPTEFSDHAPEVFQYAAEMAYFFQARLVVMHAYGKPEFRKTGDKEIAGRAKVVLKKLMDFVNEHIPAAYRNQIEVDYFAPVNYPVEAILDLALEQEVDLIVMGMTGKTNALETLFGSTALGILAKADCPVLAIPATAKFEGIDNMIYTTNFEFRDLAAINYLERWSRIMDAPVHCLHVIEKQDDEMAAMRNMNILKETYLNQEMLFFDLVKGDFQEEVRRYSKRTRADIVTMSTHKRSFISRLVKGSTVQGLARKIDIPLLVIKDNAYELDNETAEWVDLINSIA